MGIDWDNVGGDFERHEKLKMKVGDKVDVVFQDEGNVVEASKIPMSDRMKESKVKPRDSYVFVLKIGDEMKEWWMGTSNFSVLAQLKKVRETNNNKLEGAKATIERVSDELDKTNYTITPA